MEKRRDAGRDVRDRWARLRFAVIGPLLSAPPKPGTLKSELDRLAAQLWRHPVSGEPVRFGRSTIERWYYAARSHEDPLQSLRQRIRRDHGRRIAFSGELAQVLLAQYREHPGWSYRLHAANLEAVVRERPQPGDAPSEASVRRFLQSRGLYRQRKKAPTARRGASSSSRCAASRSSTSAPCGTWTSTRPRARW
jgi:hypothetical protein